MTRRPDEPPEAVRVEGEGGSVGPPAPHRALRLLLIDDEPAVLRPLAEYFRRRGHEVELATTGGEGLAQFRRVRPDVTVLDLHLPDLSGMEVLSGLRVEGASVIMLTGDQEIQTAVEAMRRGAENFLVKPIDVSHLEAAVEKAAEKASLRRRNVELGTQLARASRRRTWGRAVFALLLVASLLVGWIIGGGVRDREYAPIPVPLEAPG